MSEAPRSSGRELGISVLLLVLGGGLALLCVGRPWWHGVRISGNGTGVSSHPYGADGTAVTERNLGVDAVLPLVCMAAAGAVLASRARLRVAVGVLSLAATVGLLVLDLHALRKRDHYVGATASSGVHATAWPYLALVGAVLAVIGALMVVVRSRSWPALGQRYEAPGSETVPEPVAAQAVSDRGVWDALDRGEDPT